jgi:hypothetical protein
MQRCRCSHYNVLTELAVAHLAIISSISMLDPILLEDILVFLDPALIYQICPKWMQ